jgi:protease-4
MNPQDETSPAAEPQPTPAVASAAEPVGVTAAAPTPAPSPAPTTAAATAARIESAVERLVDALLRDRRADRRWRVFIRVAWLALGAILLWAVLSQRGGHGASPTGPHTALIEIRGEIAADTEASADQLVTAIKSAFEDNNAQAVVMRINSPGGSPVQAGIVNDEIRRLKLLHKKKVYAVVEEVCASGAYYIAAAADEIFVDKASIVGSIGVLMDGFGFTGIMEKVGVERRLMTAGENKGMLDPFSPVSDRQRGYAQAMLDQIHRQFIKVVREGRGKRLHETPELFTGLFWNGEQALELGLADHYGNLDYVAREIVKAEEVVDYTQKENVAERLAKRFGAAVGEGVVRSVAAAGVKLH